MFGYTRDQLTGHAVDMLLPEGLRTRHAGHRDRFLAELAARPMGANLEVTARRADGTEFPAEIGLNPIQAEGEILIASTIRNLSQGADLVPPGAPDEYRAGLQN